MPQYARMVKIDFNCSTRSQTSSAKMVSWKYFVGCQVMLRQNNGEYACVAERSQRYNLGEVCSARPLLVDQPQNIARLH